MACALTTGYKLGCQVPQEFSWYKDMPFIETIDTSNPIMATLDGIQYGHNGLTEKPKSDMNHNFYTTDLDYNLLEFTKPLKLYVFKDRESIDLSIRVSDTHAHTWSLPQAVFAAMSSEKEADKLEIALGKVLGDFVARFSQPFVFKSAYEFFDLFREEGAVQRDPNVITAEGSGDRFLEAATNRVQGKLPVLKEELPEAIPRLREGPVYKEGEFFYSLVGVREAPPKTVAEKEIVRLGIDPFKLYGPSSGDRLYDRAFVEAANPMVISAIERTIANKRYQALSPTEQKLALTNVVRDVTSIARDKTDGKFMSEDLLRVKKMRFDKLSQDQRKVINERYARDNNGVTLEEAKDYKAVDKYEAMLGNLAFAKGGVVGKVLGKKAVGEAAEPILETLKKKAATVTPTDDAAIDTIINKQLSSPAPSESMMLQLEVAILDPVLVPITTLRAPVVIQHPAFAPNTNKKQ